jgi:hypothetical protein
MSGCAIGKDGRLLDAAKIVFYHNADDNTPISGPSTMIGPVTAHLILGPPTHKLAGSHQPQYILHPSTKLWDPNNVESAKSASKHKAADKPTVHCVARKIAVSSDSDKENADPDVNDEDYPPLVEVQDSDNKCDHEDGGDMEIDANADTEINANDTDTEHQRC